MHHRSRSNSTLTRSSPRFSGNGCLPTQQKMATWLLLLTCTSRASGTYEKMETTIVGFPCPTRMTQPNIDPRSLGRLEARANWARAEADRLDPLSAAPLV